jgi:glycogen synthase
MSSADQPRRILMTADAVGGVWNYALELSRGLGARGVEVVLATMGPRPAAAQRAAAVALDNVTLCESDFRLEWMETPWRDVSAAGEWLLELEAQFAPDLVHLNGYAHGALPWRAPALVVGHSCVRSWWRAVRGGDAPPEWKRYTATVAAGLRGADAVVAPTHAMLEALARHYGDFGGGIVIPNGCDPTRFAAVERKEPFVLSVGRLWDEAKNAAALAAIAPSLPWLVRVVGDTAPPDGRAARTLANVESLGRCSPRALAPHYARASIYALPARYEPFGLSVLEAAMSRCALVLGDIPSLRETWDGAAVFVPPSDHAALHAAIEELIDDPMLRLWIGARAERRALAFSAERMVASYFETYHRVLAGAECSAGLSPAFSTAAGGTPAHLVGHASVFA